MFGAWVSFSSRHFFHTSGLAFVIGLWLFSTLSPYPGTSEVLPVRKFQDIRGAAGVFSPNPTASALASPRTSATSIPTLSLLASQAANNKQTGSSSPSPAAAESDETGNLVGEVNSFRAKNGKSDLDTSAVVCGFAKKRLSELYSNYSHAGFDANWKEMNMHAAAENIAMTSRDMGNHFVVFEMWAKSEGHRLNMLGDYTQGCGYYDGYYAVFNFAR